MYDRHTGFYISTTSALINTVHASSNNQLAVVSRCAMFTSGFWKICDAPPCSLVALLSWLPQECAVVGLAIFMVSLGSADRKQLIVEHDKDWIATRFQFRMLVKLVCVPEFSRYLLHVLLPIMHAAYLARENVVTVHLVVLPTKKLRSVNNAYALLSTMTCFFAMSRNLDEKDW